MPSCAVLRKYIDQVHAETFDKVHDYLELDKIYISLDGTTDAAGRHVAAFIAGSLENLNEGPFLINLAELKDGTSETYYDFVIDSLNILYKKQTGRLETKEGTIA